MGHLQNVHLLSIIIKHEKYYRYPYVGKMGSISYSSGTDMREQYDAIVVGGGNAALCMTLSAHDNGARVLVLEAAPREGRGGNSRFAGTVFRASHTGMGQVNACFVQKPWRMLHCATCCHTRTKIIAMIFAKPRMVGMTNISRRL